MRKMIFVGALSLFAMPAFAQSAAADLQNEVDQAVETEYQDMMSGLLYDHENTISVDARGPGGNRPGNPGGGMHRPPGNPGGGMHRPPSNPPNRPPGGGMHRPPGNPGGGMHRPPSNPPHRPPGGIHRPPTRPPGGVHQPPRNPGPRFPGHGQWGRGDHWWRGSHGSNWHIHYRWWPGFVYYRGACFAEDDDGYLFAGRSSSRAVLNCQDNSPVGGCLFVGCD